MEKKLFHFFAFAAAISLSCNLVLFPSSAFAAASATLVKIDTATMGSWIGAYGSDGYLLSQYSVTKYPAYAKIAVSKQANWTWAASTSRLAAVQKPDNPQDRIAGQWFSGTSFFIDIALTDGRTHQIALYALDWDRNQRAETINVRDAATGALLDSRPLSAGTFIEGVYLAWNVQGHITFEIARNAGANSTLSALFFDPKKSGQASIKAVPANNFLSSLGIDPGYLQMMTTAPLFQYTGIRNYRIGTGDPSNPIALHNATVTPGIYPGVRFNLVGHDVPISARIAEGAALASAGALLSFEGPNEPNSFPFTYNGQIGGGSHSWLPVAQYQRDFYAAVKADPRVSSYPVFGTSLVGSELDNVGMQFLTIPTGANVLMSDGTRYADYANPHNYVVGNGGCGVLRDNQAWNAADPILPGCWDNLYNEYGVTWYGHYAGYTEAQLMTLPRVTTETGWGTSGISEDNQGKVLLNVLLAQFKRGWSYTFIYELVDGGGSPASLGWGIFHSDYTPKIAATYIHNLTTVLADTVSKPAGKLTYSIPAEPITVHDLLLQKSNGTYYLIVWDERVPGTVTDNVTVVLATSHASISVYDPTIGTTPVLGLTNASTISLQLSDHPQILAISNP